MKSIWKLWFQVLYCSILFQVALLGNLSNINKNEAADLAYEFGKNFGMAFQLIDDLLDMIATDDDLGKPATVDLKLGLSTAPVLFASQQVLNTIEVRVSWHFRFQILVSGITKSHIKTFFWTRWYWTSFGVNWSCKLPYKTWMRVKRSMYIGFLRAMCLF